jgi:hypothetical protein
MGNNLCNFGMNRPIGECQIGMCSVPLLGMKLDI